jgi:CPA1 family monovalent cation:H+ antiporter
MNTNGTDVRSLELIVVVAVGVLATGRLSRRRFGVPEAATLRMAQDIEDRRAPAPGSIRRRESVRRLELAPLQGERDTLRDLRDAGRSTTSSSAPLRKCTMWRRSAWGQRRINPTADTSPDDPARS